MAFKNIIVKLASCDTKQERIVALILLISFVSLSALVIDGANSWRKVLGKAKHQVESGKRKKVATKHYTATWLWRTALANSALLLALLLSRKLWLKSGYTLLKKNQKKKYPHQLRRTVIPLLLLLLLAASLRIPRLKQSIYNDEEYNWRRFIAGAFEKPNLENQNPKFKTLTWTETAFGNSIGNNPILYSLLARASYEIWLKFSGKPRGTINEVAIRLPTIICGLASLLVCFGLARLVTGSNILALAFTAILVIFPWHIRYSTDARPYGIVLLASACAIYFGLRAIEFGNWKNWLAFGFSNFICLYANVGSFNFLLALNLALAIAIIVRKNYLQLISFAVCNILAAGLFFQFFSPALEPFITSITTLNAYKGSINARWWAELASYFTLGIAGYDVAPKNPHAVNFAKLASQPLFWLPLGIMCFGFASGFVAFFFSRIKFKLVFIISMLGLPLTFIMSYKNGLMLHHWYVIMYMPIFLLICMAGLRHLCLASNNIIKMSSRLLLAMFLLNYPLLLTKPIVMHIKYGKSDARSAAKLMRADIFPFEKTSVEELDLLLTVCAWTDAGAYDTRCILIGTLADLKEIENAAVASGKELKICFSRYNKVPQELRDYIINSSRYTQIGTFYGHDSDQFTNYVFKLVQE